MCVIYLGSANFAKFFTKNGSFLVGASWAKIQNFLGRGIGLGGVGGCFGNGSKS